MIEVRRTQDMDLVRAILSNEKIYGKMIDDSCPAREDFKPVNHPLKYYLIPYFRGEDIPLGSVLCHPLNAIMYQIHIGILPEFWGFRSPQILEKSIEWMHENTGCKKIIAMIPAGNKLAIALAKRCDFEQEGLIKNSVLISGKFQDLVILGR
jgi:RimJ/RimL family protein N-acetyltransferase